MVIEVNKKSLVVQSNSLVEAKYRLSVEEQKIVKILISQIQREDKDFKDYEFRVLELAKMLGMEHKDTYGVLEKITERLLSRVLKFYNAEKNTLLQASWLSSVLYKKGEGTVLLRFDPSLKPLLLQLQAYFTKYELGQVMQFKGQYTIRFFEFRKSFLGKNKNNIEFSLEKLRETFGLGKNRYRDFDNFRRRVIEPARLELLEKTGQSFSWEAIRKGRGGKVVGVRFTFDGEIEKEEESILENKPETKGEQKQEESRQGQSPIVDLENIKMKVSEGAQLLLENGISENVAIQLAEKYEAAYLREKVALANAHSEYIKNKAGFLVRAIKENWLDNDVVQEQQKNITANAEKRREETRKRVKGIWDRYKVQRDTLGLKKYEKMAMDEIEKLKKEFLAGLKDFFRNLYKKKENFGYEDTHFRSFLLKQFGFPSFEDFLVAERITLTEEEREVFEKEVMGRI